MKHPCHKNWLKIAPAKPPPPFYIRNYALSLRITHLCSTFIKHFQEPSFSGHYVLPWRITHLCSTFIKHFQEPSFSGHSVLPWRIMHLCSIFIKHFREPLSSGHYVLSSRIAHLCSTFIKHFQKLWGAFVEWALMHCNTHPWVEEFLNERTGPWPLAQRLSKWGAIGNSLGKMSGTYEHFAFTHTTPLPPPPPVPPLKFAWKVEFPLVQVEIELWTLHSRHQTQLWKKKLPHTSSPWPTRKRKEGGGPYTPWPDVSLVAWKFYS